MNHMLTQSHRHMPVLQPQNFQELKIFSDMAAQSAFVPRDYIGKPANIMLAVQMGSELGLSPMQSLQNIAVINGRPSVWGDALLGICQSSPLCENIEESIEGEGKNMVATCTVTRKGYRKPVIGTFSVKDAEEANLWNKQGPWKQYPKRMLQMRARGFALRDAFADLLRGLITAEEAQDYPTIEHTPAKPVSLHTTEPPKANGETHTIDAVLSKLNKCMTTEDVDKVASQWNATKQKAQQAGKPIAPEIDSQVLDLISDRHADLYTPPASQQTEEAPFTDTTSPHDEWAPMPAV